MAERMFSIGYTATLTCHPGSYSHAVHEIKARVCWTQDGALALTYALRGNVNRLPMPAARPPGRADRLWQHTCFEAFVSVNGKPEYYELNFAPSGEWAIYSFRRYREDAGIVASELAPRINLCNGAHSLELEAIIRPDLLPTIKAGAPLRLALSAVIEEQSGAFSYWALKHPPGRPDFHHADGFALELENVDMEAVYDSAASKQ